MTMTQKQQPPDSEPLTTPGDMSLTRISRAELLRALKTNDKHILRIRKRAGSRANAGYVISPARERKRRTKSITRPYVVSARVAKEADIINRHLDGWLMKAIVAEVNTTYKTADKVLRSAGYEPNYSNARPNKGA